MTQTFIESQAIVGPPTNVPPTKVDELKEILKATEVAKIKHMNYRLSDAIREGSKVTQQAYDWGQGEEACALSAAALAIQARKELYAVK